MAFIRSGAKCLLTSAVRDPGHLLSSASWIYNSLHDEVTEPAVHEILSITKALSDETRVRALLSIKDGELCLCQIIEVLGLAPSTVSKHMNVLQQARLVERRKNGKWHFYRLPDGPAGSAAMRALSWIVEELGNDPRIKQDAKKVRAVRKADLDKLSACYRAG
jgi:DNA-binding transcriptional ArsR family regulator